MKKLFLLLFVILSGTVVLFGQSVKTVSAEDFEKKISTTSNKIILDVRTAEEFSQGHLTGATQLDFYKSDFKQKLKTLDKTKPVFVYCQAGVRSSSAASMMTGLGFTNIYNLEGGYRAWSAAKKPTAK